MAVSLHRQNTFPAREQAQTGAEPKGDPYVDPVKELVDPKQEFDSFVSKSKIKAYSTNYSFSTLGIFHTYSNYGKELKNYMIRPLVPERIQIFEKTR